MRRLDSPETDTHVKIEDINVPFWALVGFLVKLSIAAIPATIILSFIFGLIMLVMTLITGTFETILNYFNF